MRPGRIAVVDASAAAPPPPGDPAASDLVITSYEMLARLSCAACTQDANRATIERAALSVCAGARACFAARGWRVLIVDESHALRTTARAPDARWTEAAVTVAARAPRAVFLTGTPCLGRPFDAYRQIAALAPRLLPPTRDAFADRYCGRRLVPGWGPRGPDAGVWDVGGLTRAVELRAALRGALMVRRLKAAVAAQLPPKRRQVVLLPRPPAAAWPAARGGGGGKRPAGGDASASPPPPRSAPPSMSLAQLAAAARGDGGDAAPASPEPSPSPPSLSPPSPTGGGIDARSDAHRTALAKLPAVIDWLNTLMSSDGGGGGVAAEGGASTTTAPPPKILVFAHHCDVMDGLAAALTRAGADYVRIDGSVVASDRAAAVSRFRSDPRVSAALLSVTAAGVGLDFASARSVVFVELPDEPALVVQAEDRAHRRGATSRVNVYFLIARSTRDERRWRALDAGLARLATLADGESGGEGGLAVDRVRGGGEGAHTQACTQALAEAAAAALHPPPPPPDSSASEDEGGGAAGAACVDGPAGVAPTAARASAVPRHAPWWELSPHTGRLHAHATAAGDALVGLSAPLASLAAGVEAAAAALADAAAAPGGCGAPRTLTDAWAASAADVAADLTEARGVVRAQFAGVVLRAPLNVSGGGGGGTGRGTTRHDTPRAPLPDAAPPPPRLRPAHRVRVRTPGRGRAFVCRSRGGGWRCVVPRVRRPSRARAAPPARGRHPLLPRLHLLQWRLRRRPRAPHVRRCRPPSGGRRRTRRVLRMWPRRARAGGGAASRRKRECRVATTSVRHRGSAGARVFSEIGCPPCRLRHKWRRVAGGPRSTRAPGGRRLRSLQPAHPVHRVPCRRDGGAGDGEGGGEAGRGCGAESGGAAAAATAAAPVSG